MKTLLSWPVPNIFTEWRSSNIGKGGLHVLLFSVQIIIYRWEQRKEKGRLQPLKHCNGRAKVVAIIFLWHYTAAIHRDHIRARFGAKPP